jgi:YhcH/YjgK/YiaL family protein
MIIDALHNNRLYLTLHEEFKKAFRFLLRKDILTVPCGKYPIGRKGTHAIVQEYKTKKRSDGVIECHRKYIDIQFIAKGGESIGVCDKAVCKEAQYEPERDFQRLEGETDFITLTAGHFAIFMPHDGHMPSLMRGRKSEMVRKIVIKVPVSSKSNR